MALTFPVAFWQQQSVAPPDIVTDNIALNLDAGNNSSYPGSGSTWFDLSGNNYNFSLSNITFSTDNGGELRFNGSNSLAILTTPTPTNLINWYQGNYTLEYWIRHNSFDSSNNAATNVCGHSSSTDWVEYWSFGAIPGGTIQFYFWSGAVNRLTTTETLSAGVYNQLVFTKRGTTLRLYINKTEVLSTALSASPQSSTSFPLLIGGNTTSRVNASIPIFRIYQGKGLTDSEILQNYNAIKGRFGL